MLGALLFSTGGVAIKATTLTGWQVSSSRCLVAAITLWVLLPAARRGWTWRSLLVAVPYAATFTLYALANKYTTAANAIFLQDTAPFYVLLLGPVLLHEQIRRRDLAFMAALVVGLVLIFASSREPLATAPDPALGNALAACAGVTWALTIMGLRWIAVRSLRSREQPTAAVIGGSLLAFAFCGVFSFPVEGPTLADGLIVVYLGVFQIALAYVFVTEGMRHVSALEASLLLLVEPVFSPVWAWLLLTETPGALAILGGSVVVAATALHTAQRARA